jgi:hypothetical protein
MFGFLLRKTFYDLWDNLFKIALINLGFLALVVAGLVVPSLFKAALPLSLAIMALCLLCCCVYLSASSLCIKALSDYGSLNITGIPRNFAAVWPAGVFFGAICLLGLFMGSTAIPFYFSIGSFAGLLLGSFLLWIMVAAVLAMQFYLSGRSRLGVQPLKIMKKCFIIFFDNIFFCILVGVASLVILALSVPLSLLLPGPGGVLLFLDEALRLRLLKYDWLETHPGEKKIPWDVLLEEEREKTGTRSLKGLIFPWKD